MLPSLKQTLPSLFDGFLTDIFTDFTDWNELAIRNPLHDVIENEKEYTVELSLAGVKKEDISMSLDHDILTIKAERKGIDKQKYNKIQTFYGKYEKSFTLPNSVNKENIQASFEDGILKVTIPKLVKEDKNIKQIKIK